MCSRQSSVISAGIPYFTPIENSSAEKKKREAGFHADFSFTICNLIRVNLFKVQTDV